ncbi:hypothetical protein AB0B45_02710 [Nonomuraea sp. NPDC049152]|uniref:DUF6197 family protein n=1 Tax=Nonomuraea sp. NPDC049152 TaxID=3154350 RepID=UPI0033CFA25A
MNAATVSDILSAAADRIEDRGWASRYQQPGVTISDAIAVEARDAHDADAARAALLAAAFDALKSQVAASAVAVSDWLRAPHRTQAQVVAVLRGAAEQAARLPLATEERRSL